MFIKMECYQSITPKTKATGMKTVRMSKFYSCFPLVHIAPVQLACIRGCTRAHVQFWEVEDKVRNRSYEQPKK